MLLDEKDSPTMQLCHWIHNLKWEDIPDHVKTRAKYLILDGLACALVGAHLPWSEIAVGAVLNMEGPGSAPLLGWKDKTTGVLASALINSTFIQGFELDDYHQVAPLHSNSLYLPALVAAATQVKASTGAAVSGVDFMLAMITGYEIGPRIGIALNGGNILSRGWHSGPVFGTPATAGAVGKLLKLSSDQLESAFGIACTQACGLMSAQFEASAKRMQHGFAARNGLFSALMAQQGYQGIKQVFEREYGGFLPVYSLGSDVPPDASQLVNQLAEKWHTMVINVKIYPTMAGTHATIDCVYDLLARYGRDKLNVDMIKDIEIQLSSPAFHHGGWHATRPLTAIGAQMNCAFAAAAVFLDGDISLHQFIDDNINRDAIWELMAKTTATENQDFNALPKEDRLCTKVIVTLHDGTQVDSTTVRPRGVKEPISNDDIVGKFVHLTDGVISKEQQQHILDTVLRIDTLEDISAMLNTLNINAKDPLSS
ncbi:hypothetical protein BC940DRAFT_247572 [Gongronella butleri]|nr:hypothetical protein BC940DRAFT_247572 [Gongronella butleri]